MTLDNAIWYANKIANAHNTKYAICALVSDESKDG